MMKAVLGDLGGHNKGLKGFEECGELNSGG